MPAGCQARGLERPHHHQQLNTFIGRDQDLLREQRRVGHELTSTGRPFASTHLRLPHPVAVLKIKHVHLSLQTSFSPLSMAAVLVRRWWICARRSRSSPGLCWQWVAHFGYVLIAGVRERECVLITTRCHPLPVPHPTTEHRLCACAAQGHRAAAGGAGTQRLRPGARRRRCRRGQPGPDWRAGRC